MTGFRRVGYATITFRQLEQWMERNEEMQIVDLRDSKSYGESHFKGAVNRPFEEMEDWITDLPWGELMVFYCSRGSVSMMVCNRLAAAGYSVVNVGGGYRFYNGPYREIQDGKND